MGSEATVACVGCGGVVPDVDGPTHEYMVASPGCWQLYGRWMGGSAPWSSDASIVRAHHVDCYAVQHPDGGDRDRRQRQSVAVHLIALCLLVERSQPPQDAMRARARAGRTVLPRVGRDDWPLLRPPADRGATTITDVVGAGDDVDAVVRGWTRDCWQAWHDHHGRPRMGRRPHGFAVMAAPEPCPGCGLVGDGDGPTLHKQMVASLPEVHALAPPDTATGTTVVDVLATDDAPSYRRLVWRWAGEVWQRWQPHHDTVRRWNAEALG